MKLLQVLLTSTLLLIPCFWMPHIHAGDLGSHMYNIWLVQLIEQGKLPDLFISPIATNVLFDLFAKFLVDRIGFTWGERIAVSILVLNFFWGAFWWLQNLSKSSSWPVSPLLAMFAYGYVFQVGFMNFYWSLGLCFLALAMSESPSRRLNLLWFLPLLLATTAHILPVAWAAFLWLYRRLLKRTSSSSPLWLLSGTALLIALACTFVRWRYPSLWIPDQINLILGIDQLLLKSPSYLVFSIGLLLLWVLSLLSRFDQLNLHQLLRNPALHFFALTAVGISLFPVTIQLPGFASPLAFITQRMSLTAAVLLCAFVAPDQNSRWLRSATLLLAAVFFGFMYRDSKPLMEFESALHASVRTLPPGLRVVAPYQQSFPRAFGYTHIVDRACIGHCYSYANYEPSTTQFRVRTYGPNPIVASDNGQSIEIQDANHIVQANESPLYYFAWNPESRQFKLRILRSGDRF